MLSIFHVFFGHLDFFWKSSGEDSKMAARGRKQKASLL
jgi:hypothetical protein